MQQGFGKLWKTLQYTLTVHILWGLKKMSWKYENLHKIKQNWVHLGTSFFKSTISQNYYFILILSYLKAKQLIQGLEVKKKFSLNPIGEPRLWKVMSGYFLKSLISRTTESGLQRSG